MQIFRFGFEIRPNLANLRILRFVKQYKFSFFGVKILGKLTVLLGRKKSYIIRTEMFVTYNLLLCVKNLPVFLETPMAMTIFCLNLRML